MARIIDILVSMGWFNKSILGMIGFIPVILIYNFFGKNYGVKPEAILSALFFGTVIGVFLLADKSGTYSVKDLYTPLLPLLTIVVLGIVLSAPGNILLTQAIPAAPNPALPFTILNIGSALAYLSVPVLAWAFPKYFESMGFSWITFLGISLIIAGIGLVAYKNA